MKRLDLAMTAARVPVDALLIVLAGWSAYWIRTSDLVTRHLPVRFSIDTGRLGIIILAITGLWVLLFAVSGLYATRRRAIVEESLRMVYAVSTGMMLVFTVVFFFQQIFESRFIVLAAWALAIIYLVFGRLALRSIHRFLLARGHGQRRVLLIGPKENTKELKLAFSDNPRLGFSVVGTRTHFDAETQSYIQRKRSKGEIDEIMLANPDAKRQEALELLTFCDQNHIDFFFTADLLDAATSKLEPHTYAGIPVFQVKRTPLDGWGRIYKRVFDIVGSIILIILTLPIQIVVAIVLLAQRQGGILFRKLPNGKPVKRIGEGGEPFTFIKFRSMIKDAHKLRFDEDFLASQEDVREGSPLMKFKDDPRITRFGQFLRATSIDEFPQLYLVLLGKMSLIGPRPHEPEEVARYKPEHRKVLNIKPGITGISQVSGRSDLDFEEEVRLDTLYIETWSPWLDLTILLKTPWAAIKPRKTL